MRNGIFYIKRIAEEAQAQRGESEGQKAATSDAVDAVVEEASSEGSPGADSETKDSGESEAAM